MIQSKEQNIVHYFRSIAFGNAFIHDRISDIKGGKRQKCECRDCNECYFFCVEDYLTNLAQETVKPDRETIIEKKKELERKRDKKKCDPSEPMMSEELVRWMTEGTSPNLSPRSDCG